MYEAIVCELRNVREHPNADRILLATVAGHQVVVGLDSEDGQLGVFFPEGGQIADKFLLENGLYRKHPKTGEKMGGFFDANRRVRAQNFRGEKSEGFWCPVSYLDCYNVNREKLKEGQTLSEINGEELCRKYFTPQTLRAMSKNQAKKARFDAKMFKEHFSTKKLRYASDKIPSDAIIYITEKLHGTSGRTGRVKVERELSGFQKLWNKSFGQFLPAYQPESWEYVSGSRRVAFDPDQEEDTGYYNGTTFRFDIHEQIKGVGLKKGETLYYEIVGYTEDGGRIMPAHKVTDKKLAKLFGDTMEYSYGCQPEPPVIETFLKNGGKVDTEMVRKVKTFTPYDFYVYRITQTNEDGDTVDLCWPDVIRRCKELGVKHVPELMRGLSEFAATRGGLQGVCEMLTSGPSTLDDSHIMEGVCVAVEHQDCRMTVKYKSYWFCELEGIAKNNDEYVDPEEIA